MSIHSMTITKNKIIIMEILQEAEVEKKPKWVICLIVEWQPQEKQNDLY
jgi:hypothetical protein